MKWSSALSEKFSLTEAVAECAFKVHQEIGEDSPDLIVAFVSAHHSPEYETLPQLVQDHFGETVLVGFFGVFLFIFLWGLGSAFRCLTPDMEAII